MKFSIKVRVILTLLVVLSASVLLYAQVTRSPNCFQPNATLSTTGGRVCAGTGSPESAFTGWIGDIFLRRNGSTGTTLYIKESGSNTNTGWVAVGGSAGSTATVRKTADESVSSSATLQDDNHLTFTIGASEVWTVRYTLYVDAGTTGDLKVGLSVPASATYTLGAGHLNIQTDGSINVTASSTTSIAVGGVVAGTVYEYDFTATVVNSTNAGNVVLQWAQNTSDGTATTLKTNSSVFAAKQ